MVNQIDQEIGGRLRRRREGLGLSCATVAKALDLDVAVIEAFEAGERRMSARQLQQLCGVLDAPPSYFLVAADDFCAPNGGPGERDALLSDAHRLYRAFFQIQSPELRGVLADLAEAFAKGGQSPALLQAAQLLRPASDLDDNIAQLRAFRSGPWSN
ncbi:helix-turn-helix domain-containing protein [Rhodoblastus acidophilus]|uniref:Helix-turn-helix domain-containing protein n=1 Tax=Rhodoblastus acidophilus TaxID=1074 RepID=A0A6N8DKX9_RHOAC|nr:helix-turn-helix domain-containing protein [Rhodoblastus acidophilus]MCW2274430.1 transcriptional regulator with XRE-family HTH domain [Rhodoblastus acidophilus]MTV31119.1 helix-turn-helix domain-containing protein [Rhodoblastus acidophilus]